MSEELTNRISQTEAALKELTALEEVSEPPPVDIGEIRRLTSEIRKAGSSGDPVARQPHPVAVRDSAPG